MASTPLTDGQRALVEKNMDLAHHLALDAWRKSPHTQDKDDVVAVAYEGLVVAASRFDPSRADVVDGVPDLKGAFSGYARRRINGSILDWQRRRDHVPRRQRRTYKDLQELGHGTGRTPEELADLTGLPVEKIRMIISAVEHTTISLTHDSDGPGSAWGDDNREHPTAQPVESMVLEERIRDAVVSVFDRIPRRQRLIITMRYYQGLDLATIAETLGLRLTVVRSEHAEALLDMHAAMLTEAS